MVDPRVVADLARGHPPGVQADDHRVQSVHPPLAHGATGRGVNEPARSRGTSISKGPTSESMVLVVVPPKGACRGPMSSAPPTPWPRVLGRLGPQAAPPEPPRGRAGSSPRAPVITGLSGVDLLEQAVQGPGLAQPPSHIAPVDGLVPLLSRPQSASVLPSGLTQTIEHARRPLPVRAPEKGERRQTRRRPATGPAHRRRRHHRRRPPSSSLQPLRAHHVPLPHTLPPPAAARRANPSPTPPAPSSSPGSRTAAPTRAGSRRVRPSSSPWTFPTTRPPPPVLAIWPTCSNAAPPSCWTPLVSLRPARSRTAARPMRRPLRSRPPSPRP